VRRGRRLLYAFTPAVFLLLVAVSPAVPRHAATGVERVDTAVIHEVDASLAGLSAVAERVPVPSVWPMQGAAVGGIAALAGISWLVLVLSAALALGCVGFARRDRAPPRHVLIRF
jgi:hypothetical protein